MKTRKGQTYIPLIIVSFIIVMLGIYFVNAGIHAKGYVNPEIGAKQESIIQAHHTAESIEATMRYAAQEATNNIVHTALRAQTPLVDVPALIQQEFTGLMDLHPLRVEADYTVREGDALNEYVFQGTLKIPVEESFASLRAQNTIVDTAGVFAIYPIRAQTDTPENERVITSLFGNRNVVAGSANHPGIDLRAEPGQKILAMGRGAAYSLSGSTVYVQFDNGWECGHFHTVPGPGIPRGKENAVRVEIGDVIGTTQNIEQHHLHLECWNNDLVTPVTAASIFGIEHVSSIVERTDTTSYASIYNARNIAAVDPYCLFPPTIRETMQLKQDEGIQAQLATRIGETEEEKLFETCTAYTGSRILTTPDTPTPVTTEVSNTVAVTEQNLELPFTSPYGRYSSLRVMVEDVAKEHGVDPLLAIAMIAGESIGITNKDSPTGVCGLFQVTQNTAHLYVDGETYNGQTVVVPETKTQATRTHCDPYLQAQAGIQHIKHLLKRFSSHEKNNQRVPLTHQIAYMAAAYNGGVAIVDTAIDRSRVFDPDYEIAMRTVTADTLLTTGYSQWSQADRDVKIKEIVNHGRKVAAFYTELGGAVPLLSTSSTRFGLYTYPARVTATIDTSIIDAYTQGRAALASCEEVDATCTTKPGLRALLEQAENLRRCTTPAQQYARIIHACRSDYNEQTCACRIPTQLLDTVLTDEVVAADQLVFTQNSIEAHTGEQIERAGVDWMGAFGDPELAATFFVETLASEEMTVDLATQTVRVEEERIIFPNIVTQTGVDQGAFYLRATARDDEAVQFTLLDSGGSNVCKPITPEQYCFSYEGEDYSFWIEHPVDITSASVQEEPEAAP